MQFNEFSNLVKDRFTEITKTGMLFKSSLNGYALWDVYINAFKKEHNPVFRDPESSTHNCNLDKAFIRRYGNVVAIGFDFSILTMWDLDLPKESEYYLPAKAMSAALKKAVIEDVFFETFNELNSLPYESCNKKQSSFRLGIQQNHKIYNREEADKFGVVEQGRVYQFHHFYADLPKAFVDMSGDSQATIISKYRDAKTVFQRGMNEIPKDTLELVKDLIVQGSLLDGTTHLPKIEKLLPFKKEYDQLAFDKKDNWCWVKSFNLPFAKFRNELIGTLCVELAEGKELNDACKTWNQRVDPVNYMKAKAPITKRQIQEAQKFVEENGYAESFDRRFATIDDIDINQILHSNVGKNEIKTASIFDKVKSAVSTRHKRSEFDSIEEIDIEKFMQQVLPTATSIEALVENRMEGNLVTMTTARDKNTKPILKWDNNFSWTFNGNLAGKSQIKDAVKSAGGKVDGILRFSISWNESGTEIVDFDAHATEPNRTEICYCSYRGSKTPMSGMLDVDMIRPPKMGVENITWIDKSKMKDGQYKFWIKNFCGGRNDGFRAEIEFNGELYSYDYRQPLSYKQDVVVAIVTLKDGKFTISHNIPETNTSREIWGIKTNEFNKVNLVCLSPNHWGENNVGNKHYMFMLDGCKSDMPMRSFHNENLNSDLLQHRKVMEVLGATAMINPGEKQLAGLGFNSTVKDELIVRVSGTHKRTLKIKFKN